MALWGGRFTQAADQRFKQFNDSLRFDYRLAEQDIVGSVAWSKALVTVGVLTAEEQAQLEEALNMANDSDYGLTSSVYTQDLNVAMKAIKGLKFGETYINRENFEAMQGFHAGWRKSGIGGADGKHGLNEYLQTQVVYLQS